MSEGDAVFMQAALVMFYDKNLASVLVCASEHGFDRETSRFRHALDINDSFKTPISAWIAQFYRPVSDAMFNKVPIEKVFALWRRTKMKNMGGVRRPNANYDRKVLASLRVGTNIYTQGWRAKHDWGVCK